jgi:hypothetical protein
MRHADLTCDLGGNNASLEQIRSAHAPLLESCEIAPRPYTLDARVAHTVLYRNDTHASVSHHYLPFR